ncbi:uracil-DNA glycosylase [Patescibacteria group bacterium]|nr:uracil-DNA glycosylase [Patescibacteria group bacterium]MBU1755153.1 uracil-DNA glycosylase [Patescibacteria group bacterium]
MNLVLESSWNEKLSGELKAPYFAELVQFVEKSYQTTATYPDVDALFRAFEMTPFKAVKVVILGQDPYHGEGQATGLSFSVPKGVRLPPSLQNIFKELKSDIGIERTNGDLTDWAQQGVLLLNATLTVSEKSPGSHQNKGWEVFTDAVLQTLSLSDEKEHIVFILWGAYAQKKGALIDRSKHVVVESPHPSPFSARKGFFGSKPFSRTNAQLRKWNQTEIEW